MEKILVIADSTCDLTLEQEEKLGIKIINCGVEIDGLPYKERTEINIEKIFEHVDNGGSFPHHSQINIIDFMEEYMKAARDGYTHIICVTMNSQGSGTFSAANHAIELLNAEYPALDGKITIRVIDSRTYSLGTANGLIQGLWMLQKGEGFESVCAFLEDYFASQVTFVGLHNLNYARKSGRLNATAAIVGDVLGIKPVLAIKGTNEICAKVRGDKNLIPKMAELYFQIAQDPINGAYSIGYGLHEEYGKALVAALKKLGCKANPVFMQAAGPCVCINAGPTVIGMGFKCKK